MISLQKSIYGSASISGVRTRGQMMLKPYTYPLDHQKYLLLVSRRFYSKYIIDFQCLRILALSLKLQFNQFLTSKQSSRHAERSVVILLDADDDGRS